MLHTINIFGWNYNYKIELTLHLLLANSLPFSYAIWIELQRGTPAVLRIPNRVLAAMFK